MNDSQASMQGDYAKKMTLRDYFAGQALIGYLSSAETISVCNTIAKQEQMNIKDFTAKCCYGYADAMLKAREAKL